MKKIWWSGILLALLLALNIPISSGGQAMQLYIQRLYRRR